MFTIEKEFHFSAAHQLQGLGKDHPCGRVHGHNYILRVFLQSERLDEIGFVQDYKALNSIKKFVDENMDHRNLNDLFDCNTTVENISRMIYRKFKPDFPMLKAIEMSETPKTNCRYEP